MPCIRPKCVYALTPLLILTVWCAQVLAAQVQFAWDAPTTYTDGAPITNLAGYRLYWWQGSGGTPQSIDVGNQTTYTLTGLVNGATYTCAVTAYDTSGIESSQSQPITITISVPVAVADAASTPAGTPVTIAVLANDTSPSGSVFTIAAVTQGAHGAVTYTPAAAFSGIDSFTYTVSDGHGGYATSTVTVTVFVLVQFEAEAGTVYAPMAAGTDTTDPTLQYVWVPQSTVSTLDPLQTGGYVKYSFNVPTADGYVIWGRVSLSQTGTGSFFIGVDEPAGNGLISNVSPATYQVATLHTSDQYYVDRTYTVTSMPAECEGLGVIKTANADKSNASAEFLTSTLLQNATLYVDYDARGSTFPPWLTTAFTDTGQTIQTTHNSMALWKKDVLAGPITLPGNQYQGTPSTRSQYFVLLAFQGPPPYLVWDITPPPSSPPPPPWLWDQAANTTTPVFFLGAGNHTLIIRQRDSGSKLNKLLITNNLSLMPQH